MVIDSAVGDGGSIIVMANEVLHLSMSCICIGRGVVVSD